eukprot:5248905-Pyramimonas_sp.AAC.1
MHVLESTRIGVDRKRWAACREVGHLRKIQPLLQRAGGIYSELVGCPGAPHEGPPRPMKVAGGWFVNPVHVQDASGAPVR